MKKLISIIFYMPFICTGQVKPISQIPLAPLDTFGTVVGVKDSSSKHIDQRWRVMDFVKFIDSLGGNFSTLQAAIENGDTSSNTAYFTNGLGRKLAFISDTALSVKDLTGDTASHSAKGLWVNNAALGYGLWQGGYGWVQYNNGGGNAFITGGFHGGRIGVNDYNSNVSDTIRSATQSATHTLWIPYLNTDDSIATRNQVIAVFNAIIGDSNILYVTPHSFDSGLASISGGSQNLTSVLAHGDSANANIFLINSTGTKRTSINRGSITLVSSDSTQIISIAAGAGGSPNTIFFEDNASHQSSLQFLQGSTDYTWTMPPKTGIVSLSVVGSYTNATPSTATTFTVTVPNTATSCVATSATPAVIVVTGCSISGTTMTITTAAMSIGAASITLNYVYQ